MEVIRENKFLTIWLAVALAAAFYGFYTPRATTEPAIVKETEPDTVIYFSFTKAQKHELEQLFNNLHDYQGLNGVVMVGQRDSIFYADSYGYANYRLRDSLTLNSAFQLASVSKQFTAVAILQLYQKGLLNLTDSVQKFFPGFPYKGITIHRLLVHRSGLPNYHYFLQHIPTTYDTLINNQQVVQEMLEKQPAIYYYPGRRYQYSNTGYALLAAIVEKVSGESFEDYLDNHIFKPLDMTNAFAYRADKEVVYPPRTTGYLRYWRPAEDNYLDGVLGDKGVYCSALDLLKWDQGLYKGIVIDPDTLNLAFKPMGKPKYYRSNYGYGWRMFNWGQDTTKVIFHAGWWHGYRSLVMRIPKDTTTIVVLKNRSRGAQVSTRSLMRILYPLQPQDSTQNDSIENNEFANHHLKLEENKL